MPSIDWEKVNSLYREYGRNEPFKWTQELGLSRKKLTILVQNKVLNHEKGKGFRFTSFAPIVLKLPEQEMKTARSRPERRKKPTK